ncbi:MAG: UDP-N-acetylmuramoyl-L-alanine--D-glutamate ligase [Opitutales bacterium]
MALWPELLRQHLDRPVAVLGWGVSGQAAADAVRAAGGHVLAYDALGHDDASTEFTEATAVRHRLVVFSPGFPPDHAWLAAARAQGCACLPEMDLGALLWPGALLAVTGTNGKTTLTEFLAHALRTAGTDAVACGNLGYPLSRLHSRARAEDTVAVCEVSSFQAETLQHLRPHALLWTNFDADHLDRHGTLQAYFEAKWRLVGLLRRPRLVVGSTVAAFAKQQGRKLPAFGVVAGADAHRDSLPPGCELDVGPQRENWALASTYWQMEGIAAEALPQAAETFRVPPHRLHMAGIVNGVAYWNDSKATNFHATLAGLQHFGHPLWWIGGGRAKGGDLAVFVEAILPSLKGAFLLGETAEAIACLLKQAGIDACVCGGMDEAVRGACERATAGDIVLLSPGFSSHDLFANYTERGLAFEDAVEALPSASGPMEEGICKGGSGR